MGKVSIYCLIDPSTKKVRYVGKTAKSLNTRLLGHCTHIKREITAKDKWMYGLLQMGALPIIKEIVSVDDNEWEYWEIYYIKKYRDEGADLFNIHHGGQVMPKKHKPISESKVKMYQIFAKN